MHKLGSKHLFIFNNYHFSHISGVGVSGGDKTKDKLNPTFEYTKSKDRCGRRKQRIQDVIDINTCVKMAAYKGSGKGSQDVIDYYLDLWSRPFLVKYFLQFNA